MNMARTSGLLLAQNFKNWLSARGFFLVVLAALIPLVLTGSWVATHQRDVAVVEANWAPMTPEEGQQVNFTATITNPKAFSVDGFNATIAVGSVFRQGDGLAFSAVATNRTKIERLDGGETRQVTMTWNATAGFYAVLVTADVDETEEVPEIDEYNNQKAYWIEVLQKTPNATAGPSPPANLTGPSGSAKRADLVVGEIFREPSGEIKPNGNVTFFVNVTNNGPDTVTAANLTLRYGDVFSGFLYSSQPLTTNVSLAQGQSQLFELPWREVPAGVHWVEAFINVTEASDPDGSNNHRAMPFVVHVRLPEDAKFPDPPERLTIKEFYAEIIGNIQISMLIPFIALFYAAGAVADERERGNLAYILTRPVRREMIPAAKFIASFLVASVALAIGVLGTYFLLLGTPNFGAQDVGLLTTPLFISLLALLCYGALFLLVGVVFERPYLTGLLFIAWEWFVAVGSVIQLRGFTEPLLAPWVKNATIYHHLNRAFTTWKTDMGVQWLPAEVEPLWWVLGGTAAALLLSAYVMRTREFDV